MKCGFAIAVMSVALAFPASGQHGTAGHGGSSIGSGGHGGFAGRSGGFTGHAGPAGRVGFSGYSRPAGSRGYGAIARPGMSRPGFGRPGMGRPGLGRPGMGVGSGLRIPYRGSGAAQYRPQYRPEYDAHGGRDGERGRRRSGWLAGSYGYPGAYGGWGGYPYPFVLDPGFYDWGDAGDGGEDQSAAAPDYPPYTQNDQDYGNGWGGYPAPMPYPAQAPYAPEAGATAAESGSGYAASAATRTVTEEPLTVIFKDRRTPQKLQNYIMNSKAITDLDPQHYERIPLDQVDIAATEELNRTRGVDFEVPGGGRQ